MKSVEQLVICPFCGYHANRASELHDDGSAPQAGDVSMCITCGQFSIFDPSLPQGLRKPTTWQEKCEIAADPECFKAYLAWEQTVGRRRLQ